MKLEAGQNKYADNKEKSSEVSQKEKRTANIIGASGLVGKQLVKILLENENFGKVKIFVRRDTGIKHQKLEQEIIDFWDEKSWKKKLNGDILFSALGTTLKQAGGQKNQYKIDFTLNYNFARKAQQNGIKNYVLVSSMSANAKSKLFYPRMKGELDEAVAKLGFNRYTIIRPGPLTGNREEKRWAEVLFVPLFALLTKFVLKKYRPISDVTVARAMINAALQQSSQQTIWEGEDVFRLAENDK